LGSTEAGTNVSPPTSARRICLAGRQEGGDDDMRAGSTRFNGAYVIYWRVDVSGRSLIEFGDGIRLSADVPMLPP
jgi:hypothetical protein